MNKFQKIVSLFGKDFAEEFEREVNEYPMGNNSDHTDGTADWWRDAISSGTNPIQYSYMLEPSGSSYVFEGFGDYITTGHRHDHPRYELWKCVGCGHVHKVGETLECTHCGHPITEKSRFILE